MENNTKTCRKCGAPFAPSRNDVTVNCPSCRASAAHRQSNAEFEATLNAATAAMYVAQQEARAFRAEHGRLDPVLTARFTQLHERVNALRAEEYARAQA